MSQDCLERLAILETRLEGVRERIRDDLSKCLDQIAEVRQQAAALKVDFPSRREHDLLVDQIRAMSERYSNMQGRYATWAVVFSAGVIVLNLLINLWSHLPGGILAGK